MKANKIVVIILALALTGGVVGGFGYKLYSQEKKPQKLEGYKTTEVKANSVQNEVKSNDKQIEVKSKNEQSEVKAKNEQAKVIYNNNKSEGKSKNEQAKTKTKSEENKLTHSDFEAKVQSYVTEFRKADGDVWTFNQNLNSINIEDLNTEDKAHLNNLKLAAKDWNTLIANASYFKDTPEPCSEDTLNCVREILDEVNSKNLIAMGLMSKTDVDKYISYLKEYENKAKSVVDEEERKDKELNRQREELVKQHAKLKTKQEKEQFYYKIINDAMQREIKYIDSIKDPNIKGMVQSPMGAAIGMETSLEMLFPEDAEILRDIVPKIVNPS